MELNYVIQTFISSLCISIFIVYNGYKMFLGKFKCKFNDIICMIVLTLLITLDYLFLDRWRKILSLM